MSSRNRIRAKLGIDALALLPFQGDGLQFVNDKTDFGPSVNGVITLEAGKTYFVIGDIDLQGDRLETGGVVTLLGTSSETSSITSTGLTNGVPLFTSRYTIPVRFITFKDVHTAIYIDDDSGANAPLAVDWLGVNFLDVTVVGEVGTVDNFIYDTGAFLNSQGLTFTGAVGTVGMANSLFQGDGSAVNILEIAATATITRRFRVIYSSIIAFGSTTGIAASTSATIPVEGFILDTVNFSGGGAYVSGVEFGDNKSRWSENRGVANSSAISNYFMNGNATATVIPTVGTAVKVAGTTTSASVTQKFNNTTTNRSVYTGSIQRDFKVTVVLSAVSGNNNEVGIYLAKNGSIIPESEIYITTNAAGRAENGVAQTIVPLVADDFIEVFVENSTAIANITVSELSVIVEALN